METLTTIHGLEIRGTATTVLDFIANTTQHNRLAIDTEQTDSLISMARKLSNRLQLVELEFGLFTDSDLICVFSTKTIKVIKASADIYYVTAEQHNSYEEAVKYCNDLINL